MPTLEAAIHAAACVIRDIDRHLVDKCPCPALNDTCPTCALRIDGIATLDEYRMWCQATGLLEASLQNTLHALRAYADHRMADCAECMDAECWAGEALAEFDAAHEGG